MSDTFGLMVVSDARKLLLEVAAGPVVEFPEGAHISEYGANNDAPVIVVRNATDTKDCPDGSWQGAGAGDFIIVNEVPGHIAEAVLDRFDGSNESIQVVIDYLTENGCEDQYTTGLDFWENKLTPAGRMIGRSGLMKRDDRDLTPVYYDEKGILRIVPNKELRHIELDILLRTYRMSDGSKIDEARIPRKKKAGILARMFS